MFKWDLHGGCVHLYSFSVEEENCFYYLTSFSVFPLFFPTHCIDVIVEISSGYIWMRHIKVTSCLVKHLRQYVKHITVSQIWSPLNSHDPFFLSFEYVMIIWLFQCPPLSVSVTSCFTNIMQISSRCCSYHIWGDNRGLCLCPLNKEGGAGCSSCFKQIDGM